MVDLLVFLPILFGIADHDVEDDVTILWGCFFCLHGLILNCPIFIGVHSVYPLLLGVTPVGAGVNGRAKRMRFHLPHP